MTSVVPEIHLLSEESNIIFLYLVFQMTVRMASCAELAADFKVIEEIQSLYWQLEKSATPTTLLLPWFPGPAKKRKERVTCHFRGSD